MFRDKKRVFSIIAYILLFWLIVYSGFKIFKWQKENKHNDNIKEKINSAVKIQNNKYQVDFESLKKQNNDTVAWIKVNNTNIEYPVVKSSDNQFYLNHSFDKSDNTAGWIFADYKNRFDDKDKNIVLYGHNRKDNSMFGSLKNILYEEWYNNSENTDIVFITQNENCIYKVFSVYQIEKESYYIKTRFNSDDEFEEFIKTLKQRSIKNFDEDVSKNDRIITLSTCAGNDNYRVVLHAKKC